MKRKIISLLLCLVMALSLIPTVAFAKVEGPKPGGGTTYNHIDIRVDGTLTIDSKVNDVSQDGYPKDIKVTTSNVSGTVNDKSVSFSRKTGQGEENEWRAEKENLKTTDTITIKCTITGTIDDSKRSWEFEKTYTQSELEAAVKKCPGKNGFDIDIEATELMEQFTKTVRFFTANKEQGLLNTDKESVIHSGLLVDSTFPAVPTLNPADGYEFDGWYEADANGGKTGTEKVTTFPRTVTDDAYYVAVWKAKAPTTGSLTITKELSGVTAAEVKDNLTFTFSVKDANNTTVKDNISVEIAAGNTTGSADVSLPVGSYTVVENDPVLAPAGYKLSNTVYDYGKIATNANATSANVTENGATVTVTNTYEKLPIASDTINIPVEKVWSDGNDNHTETVTVKLLANGTVVENEIIELNANNNWTGTFTGLPKKDAGKDIEYTVEEVAFDGYTASYTQPVITGLSVSEWGNKITPASTLSYNVTGNLLVGKKGGSYFVWTRDTLNETQKNDLMAAINDANLEGLGKSLTATNTTFASGESASFDNGDVTINNDKITFAKENVWSLFYCGKLTPSSVTEAIITNTPVVPKTYTVEIPVTKTVSAKVGSTLPQNLPSFTFKAYQDKVVVDTLTLELNENTKVSGAQNQYQGTLTATIPAAILSDGPVVLTIKELPGIDTKWTYDTKEYTVYVINGQEGPELVIMLDNDPVNSISFENVYSYKYTPTPKPTTPTKPVTSVQTGDMGVALYAGLAILSMTGSAGVILRRRKNDK